MAVGRLDIARDFLGQYCVILGGAALQRCDKRLSRAVRSTRIEIWL
jgi:hypothetical protein